jgi:hypothetical protein
LHLQEAAIAAFHIVLPRIGGRREAAVKQEGPYHCRAIMSEAGQISNIESIGTAPILGGLYAVAIDGDTADIARQELMDAAREINPTASGFGRKDRRTAERAKCQRCGTAESAITGSRFLTCFIAPAELHA